MVQRVETAPEDVVADDARRARPRPAPALPATDARGPTSPRPSAAPASPRTCAGSSPMSCLMAASVTTGRRGSPASICGRPRVATERRRRRPTRTGDSMPSISAAMRSSADAAASAHRPRSAEEPARPAERRRSPARRAGRSRAAAWCEPSRGPIARRRGRSAGPDPVRRAGAGGRLPQPRAVVALLVQRDRVAFLERQLPPVVARRQSRLLVGAAQHPERVLVEPEPDVQTVLVDPLAADRRSPEECGARPLAPLPPSAQLRSYTVTSKRRRSAGDAVSAQAAARPPQPPPRIATLVADRSSADAGVAHRAGSASCSSSADRARLPEWALPPGSRCARLAAGDARRRQDRRARARASRDRGRPAPRRRTPGKAICSLHGSSIR